MPQQQNVCEGLEPKAVLHYFEEICSIPHGSYHTEKISNYIAGFAEGRGLRYVHDKSGNVIIWKKGTGNSALKDSVILQGHMDMVLDKTGDCPIDLEKDPISLQRKDDLLYADRTTLGGDDGIAVAMMLAILDDDSIEHPPLECIFTVDEEVGMLGAASLDVSSLKSKRMINLDSEQEGVFIVGCAGGSEVLVSLPAEKKERQGLVLTISVSGLTGGHSGVCIGEGRANANIILGRMLYHVAKTVPFRLISIEGGSKDNAIPNEAKATVLLDPGFSKAELLHAFQKKEQSILSEYRKTDPQMSWSLAWGEDNTSASCLSRKDTRRVLQFLYLAPNGLMESCGENHSTVQTSLNLGVVKTEEYYITADYLIRSSVNSQKEELTNKITSLADVLHGTALLKGDYPAWEKSDSSALCEKMTCVYKTMNGKEPLVQVIHGGVECGILASKIPGLDCVSIGPDMMGIHTPNETLSISSAERVYAFLCEVLKEME